MRGQFGAGRRLAVVMITLFVLSAGLLFAQNDATAVFGVL